MATADTSRTTAPTGNLELLNACQDDDEKKVESLLNNIDVNVNQCDSLGHTPLWFACQNSNELLVSMLLDRGAIVNQANMHGKTPLHIACLHALPIIVRLLLEHGANVNEADMNGHTPLLIASANGFWTTAKVLLEYRADVNKVNTNGVTPLYIASANGFQKTAKLLLDNGANVNQVDGDGYTPLYMVCWQGRAKTAKVLLDNGANVDQGVTDGATPLYVACREGRADTVKVLLDFGADPNIVITNRYDQTPFYIACYLARVEIVTILLGHNIDTTMFYVDFDVDDVVERNEWCLTQGLLQQVLQFAIDKNLWKSLENVLNIYQTYNNPSPTISQNSNEMSLLHYAIQQFKVSDLGSPFLRKILTNTKPRLPFNMLQDIFLFLYGTNIFNCSFGIILNHYRRNHISLDEQDADGNTPLHMAATLGHVEIVQQLLNAGADHTILNTAGQTSQQIADSRTNPVIEDIEDTNEIRKPLKRTRTQGQKQVPVYQQQEALLKAATERWQKQVEHDEKDDAEEIKEGTIQQPPPKKPNNGSMSNLQQNLAL